MLWIRVHRSSKIMFSLTVIAAIFSGILTFHYYGYGEHFFSSDKQLSTEPEIRSPFLSGTEQQHYDFLEFVENLKKTLWNTSEGSRSVISNSSYHVHIPNVNVPGINCAALFNGSIQHIAAAHVHQKKWQKQTISDNVYVTAAADCTQYISQRRFTMRPLSGEEAAFPLAFSIVMFRDVELFERLLRAIYRPQNFYCVHVDKKSASTVHKAVAAIASCFSNVFTAPHVVDVQWGTYTVLEPELICMEALLSRSKKWRYLINLTGQEFPLKTNWDIVKILKVLRGANNVEGTVKRMNYDRFENLSPLPFDIHLTKGSVHIIASRAFVDFVIHNETAVEFRDWIKDSFYPDETFFSSLNHSPELGVPGAYLGEPETDSYQNLFIARFKNWGDGPFNWPCHGKRVRNVCVLGIGDLPLLAKRPELFANKFHLDFEPTALDCLEELHYNRTYDEAVGVTTFNVSFYTKLSYVVRHQ